MLPVARKNELLSGFAIKESKEIDALFKGEGLNAGLHREYIDDSIIIEVVELSQKLYKYLDELPQLIS